MYTKDDCIEALQKARTELGETPGIRQYRELDISPSHYTIKRKFGSWNKAKEAAGLEKLEYGDRQPDRSGENNPRWNGGKTAYIEDLKKESSCKDCGESHKSCLEFHHTDPGEKMLSVSRMAVTAEYGIDDLKNEVSKCDLICRNCHAKRHYEG